MLFKKRSEKIPVLVFGPYVAAYGLVKSLKKERIPIYLVVKEEKGFLIHSSFIKKHFVVDPNDEFFIEKINSICSSFAKIVLMIGGSDEYLDALSLNYDRLSKNIVPTFPKRDMVDLVRDKISTYRICEKINIGYPKAKYYSIDSLLAISEKEIDLTFPLIFKYVNASAFQQEYGFKAFLVYSVQEIKELLKVYSGYNDKIMLSEYIPGDDSKLHNLITISDQNGKVIGYFSNRKVRTDGAFSSASCMVNFYSENLIKEGIKLIEEIGYVGAANPEFKFDERDGKLKLMEINGRFTLTISHALTSGNNLPLILYNSVLGKSYTFNESKLKTKRRNKWLLINADLNQAKREIANKKLTWWEYMKTLKASKIIVEPFCIYDFGLIFYFIKRSIKWIRE
jgi:D-aspartate ligase